jgi:hypothetical protein
MEADIRLMSQRVIDRRDWVGFADGFSRRHQGWLISLALEEGATTRAYATRDVPLRGIVAEGDEETASVMIFTGDETPHVTHFIEHPARLAVDETADGTEMELAITDASGTRTIVELRSPIRTELVDGMA